MNGPFNYNSLVVLALAKGLPQNEALPTALAAGQMRPGNALGAILLKPLIDERVAQETRRVAAEQAAQALQSEIALIIPFDTSTVTLSIPNATFEKLEGSDAGTIVDNTTGQVTLPDPGDEIIIAVKSQGVTRRLVITRTELDPHTTERRGNGQREQASTPDRAVAAGMRAGGSERRPSARSYRADEGTTEGERQSAKPADMPGSLGTQTGTGPADVAQQAAAAEEYPGTPGGEPGSRRRGK
jgi:hypothetical protein